MNEAPPPKIRGWLWWTARAALAPVFRGVLRVRATGVDNIPADGAVLLVCNHISMWDPPMVAYAMCPRRRVYFMAKSELMALPVAGWAFANIGAFGVDRGGADRSAIRTARKLLAEGQALLMFPEGTRHQSGELGDAFPGAGALARVAGTRVVPVAIVRSTGRFGPVRIAIGAPIALDDIVQQSRSAQSQAVADRMMEAIRVLRDGIQEETRG